MDRKRWALLSVCDTTGIVDFARCLSDLGYELVGTPGTRTLVASAGIPIQAIEEVTGYPLVFGGMVKCLHPHIFSGILLDHTSEADLEEAAINGIPVFDIVAINVPLMTRISTGDINVGHTDVGGIAVMRAAASNYEQVLVISEPRDYPAFLSALRSPEGVSAKMRRDLAHTAWGTVANYDARVANCFEEEACEHFPATLRGEFHRLSILKYGENPHQQAALYAAQDMSCPSIAGARFLQGPPISYNNLIDGDVALEVANEFAAPGAVIVKHAVPVSAAIGSSIAEAAHKAFEAEMASRHGAVVAVNGFIDAEVARSIAAPDRRLDLLIGTDFSDEAIQILSSAGSSHRVCRLMKTGTNTSPAGTGRKIHNLALHHVSGGILAQTLDTGLYGSGGFHVLSDREPTDMEMIDLEFALLVAKHSRSHACVLAKNGATQAIATVQTSRTEAAHIALDHAGSQRKGCVMASDSYLLPVDLALLGANGVRAVIHTGYHDAPEVTATEEQLVEICRQYDMTMLVTRMRHFSH